jgi:hypothetical protein
MIVTTYINKEILYSRIESENYILKENETNKLCIEKFIKPMFNDLNYYEGATPEEIAEYQKSLVPKVITRRQFKIALAVLGKNEDDILNGINQLPEANKTIARISYMEAGTFERFNPELIFVATNFLQMNEADIDEIFIIGNQY